MLMPEDEINRISARLRRAWSYPAQYGRLEEWVYGYNGARWNYASGWSNINGRMYYSELFFNSEEDLLICKLMFPELINDCYILVA